VKKTSSIRISEEAKELLLLLAQKWGISQSAVLELVIRRIAEQEKLR
jgi:predicted DNA-binding protein